jgi:predicted enzyme related to lactoylglutathione lyase
MPERDGYIPGVPCWIDTSQPDPEASVPFYAGVFGWEIEDVMPPGSDGRYFIARIRGGDVAGIGSIPAGAPQTATWNTYVWVDSADATASAVRDAGGALLMEPFDVGDSGRVAVCADPDGAVIFAWQPKEHRGARVVNEHGALNFNNLATRDVDAAEAFYGAVFGWHVMALDGGQQAWALPGYGDHLEERDPGIRKRISEFGGPPGFEDVVATVMPIRPDQSDVRPHWSVTFGVDDADAVAAKAAELGGTLIARPFDAPWVRMSVIADPQGATFIASQFVPENRDATSA